MWRSYNLEKSELRIPKYENLLKDGKTDTENSQTRLKQIIDDLKKIEAPELNSPARVLTGRTLLAMNSIKDGRIYLTKELSSKSHGAIAFRFLLEKYVV